MLAGCNCGIKALSGLYTPQGMGDLGLSWNNATNTFTQAAGIAAGCWDSVRQTFAPLPAGGASACNSQLLYTNDGNLPAPAYNLSNPIRPANQYIGPTLNTAVLAAQANTGGSVSPLAPPTQPVASVGTNTTSPTPVSTSPSASGDLMLGSFDVNQFMAQYGLWIVLGVGALFMFGERK